MAQFDVYRLPPRSLVVDIQSDIIGEFGTRIVVPLIEDQKSPKRIGRLHPKFQVEGETRVLATPLMAAVPVERLGAPLANLAIESDSIIAALDLAFTGI